jgi:hypothetical protein
LIGIEELSNLGQGVLSKYFVSLFRLAQPLGVRRELVDTPAQCEVIEDDQHTQQQNIEQRVLPDY